MVVDFQGFHQDKKQIYRLQNSWDFFFWGGGRASEHIFVLLLTW